MEGGWKAAWKGKGKLRRTMLAPGAAEGGSVDHGGKLGLGLDGWSGTGCLEEH